MSMRLSISPLPKRRQPNQYCLVNGAGRCSSKFISLRMPIIAFIVVLQFLLFTPLTTAYAHQCTSCGTFAEMKKIRQEQILKDLLKKLDLNVKPNITVDLTKLPPITHPDPRVQELFDRTLHATHRRVRKSAELRKRGYSMGLEEEEEEELEYFPTLYETEQEPLLQTSYIIARVLPDWFGQIGAMFKFSSTLRKSFVQSAKLNMPISRPVDELRYTTEPIRLNVFRRYANGTLSTVLVSTFIEMETSLIPTTARIEVPISADLVQQWVETTNDFGRSIEKEEEDEQGDDGEPRRVIIGDQYRSQETPNIIALYVEALYNDENLVQHSPDERNGDKAMFLELQLYPMKSGRSRRNLNMCQPGDNITRKCCLLDLLINFETIGWKFVIAPKIYNAYICSGGCNAIGSGAISAPMTRQQVASASKIDHYQCCHPKEYAGIKILFVKDNHEVLAREVPNMVAKECGCA